MRDPWVLRKGRTLRAHAPIFTTGIGEDLHGADIDHLRSDEDHSGVALVDAAVGERLRDLIAAIHATDRREPETRSAQPAAAMRSVSTLAELTDTWNGIKNKPADDLASWLREPFFDWHREQYENRPTYFALSSAKRSFVVHVNIHRWTKNTLPTVLADHLLPELKALIGEREDLKHARTSTDKKAKNEAEKRYAKVSKWIDELEAFITLVREVSEKGPPPPDDRTTAREADAPFEMDLDDGVMVNSAALWPLLEPQWSAPRKWWKELANAQGKKDYDWSQLAERYFPKRVDEKCKSDPSLAVAHKRFWRYHPAKAFQWELRLQDEIAPDFTIDEPDSDVLRERFLAEQAQEAARLRAAEIVRRERKAKKDAQEELTLDEEGSDEETDDSE